MGSAMRFRDCFELIIGRWRDELVVTSAGHVTATWWELSGHEMERVFYLEASMSLVPMFAAGLALGLPQARVWAFNGDGAFCMNPGVLAVERQLGLPNVTHFVVSNRCYGATSGVPLPNASANDYATIARGFGIERVFTFGTLEALDQGFDEAVRGQEPTFVVLEVEPVQEKLVSIPADGAEQKFRFGRHIEQTYGVRIFDY